MTKKGKTLFACTAFLTFSLMTSVLIVENQDSIDKRMSANTNPTIWNHYSRVEATQTNRGIKEYWVSCSSHSHQFVAPTDDNIQIVDMGAPDQAFINALDENDDRLILNMNAYLSFTFHNDHYSVKGSDNVTSNVVIPATYNEYPVTVVEEDAFKDNTTLSTITIPDSVTSIESNAFANCTYITDTYINVTSIDQFVRSTGRDELKGDVHLIDFLGNEITDVVIPNTVETINSNSFANCNNIETVTIGNVPSRGIKRNEPAADTVIERYAFASCDSIEEIVVGDNVVSIGVGAFAYCDSLTSITIGNSVAGIESWTFNEDYALETVDLGSNISYIAAGAFANCTSLNTIVVPDSVTEIGYGAFQYCSSLQTMTLPFVGGSATENRTLDYLFAQYNDSKPNNLNTIILSDACTSIAGEAFKGWSTITSITIGKNVASIGGSAFYGTSMDSIVVPDGASLESSAFATIVKEDSYVVVESWDRFIAATGRNNLVGNVHLLDTNGDEITEVVIPNNVVGTISDYAFYNCNSITSISIGSGVTGIGYEAFCNCTALRNVTLSNGLLTIGGRAFANCSSLQNIVVPTSVTSMGDCSFIGCSSLQSMTLPFIGGSTSSNTTLGYLFGVYRNLYSPGSIPAALSTITLSSGCTIVPSYAFYGSNHIERVALANTVTSISTYAFIDCRYLSQVIIPSSVTSIVASSFYAGTVYVNSGILYCEASSKPEGWADNWNYYRPVIWGVSSNYEPVVIDDIEYQLLDRESAAVAGYQGTDATDVNIPTTITYSESEYDVVAINPSAFYGHSELRSVVVPNSVTSIGQYAFPANLTSLSVPFIGGTVSENRSLSYVFYGSSFSLRSITVTGEESSIPADALNNFNSIQTIVLDDVLNIEDSAFSGCRMTSVVINGCDQLATIGSSAFGSCSKLTSVTMTNVKTIKNGAFSTCTALPAIFIPVSVTTIQSSAFFSCYNITIYCEADEKPEGWSDNWNSSDYPVVWGATGVPAN